MDENTSAILRLAWSRRLGLTDDALDAPSGATVEHLSDTVVTVVHLWRRRVVVGPAWFLDRARTVEPDRLVEGPRLLSLAADHGGRLLGQATLAYVDDYASHDELDTVTVTDDPVAVVDLEKRCPPDDVAEVGLAELERALVTLDELDEPLAGAGYEEWEHLIAHLGVLTPPPRRRRGHGLVAAALATNDALDAGLVPQWRSRVENTASRAVGRRLGYVEVGSQTTVLLPA